jgi:hypothetical protein
MFLISHDHEALTDFQMRPFNQKAAQMILVDDVAEITQMTAFFIMILECADA